MVVKHLNRRPTEEDGASYWQGTRIYPRVGESFGDAYRRQLTTSSPAAKPAAIAKPVAVDPRLTELRRLEAQCAELERCVPLATELTKLQAQHADLQRQLAERNKPRKGIRFGQGGFNAFKKPAA